MSSPFRLFPCTSRARFTRALHPNVLILHQPVISTGQNGDRVRGGAEEPGVEGADVRVAPDGARALRTRPSPAI